jgi:hypothetical protein
LQSQDAAVDQILYRRIVYIRNIYAKGCYTVVALGRENRTLGLAALSLVQYSTVKYGTVFGHVESESNTCQDPR